MLGFAGARIGGKRVAFDAGIGFVFADDGGDGGAAGAPMVRLVGIRPETAIDRFLAGGLTVCDTWRADPFAGVRLAAGAHAACGRCRPSGCRRRSTRSRTPIDGGALRVLGSGERRVPGDPRARSQRAEVGRDPRVPVARRRGRQHARRGRARGRRSRRARSTIHKDRIAAVYEYTGGNKQSFFHKRVDPIRGFQAWFLGAVYRAPGSFKQRPNALVAADPRAPEHRRRAQAQAVRSPKLYIIDDRYLVLGSMGIGDNHRHEWLDVMVEAEGEEHVARLRERMAGHDEFDPSRGIDFLVHSREAHRKKSCPMISHRLALIDAAEQSITVEMAYFGDRRFTAALARAVQRGVRSSSSPPTRPTCSRTSTAPPATR